MPFSPTARGYVRVSTGEQTTSGLGLDAQRVAIASAARRLGLDLVAVHEDAGLSGALDLDKRPGLLEAVAALKRGDVLLVAKRDRLGRDVIAVAMIERLVAKKGAKIVSAAGEGTEADDPAAMLMRRIIDAFAEYERLLIAARTRAALRAKRARGERAGAVPFGFEAMEDGRLVRLEREQETLALAQELRAAGKSYGAIAALLQEKRIAPKRGKKWHPETVRSVLRTAAGAEPVVALHPAAA